MRLMEEEEARSRFWTYLHNLTNAELALHLHVAIDGEQWQRRWWEKPKSRDWWLNIVMQEWDDDEDWVIFTSDCCPHANSAVGSNIYCRV